jgi:hypothetical protein
MAIHIGKIIKDTLKTKKMDVTGFAHKINYTRGNAYKIFNRPSIDTELLQKISKVLGENLFFKYLTDEEIATYRNSKVKAAEVLEALKNLEAKMIALTDEKDMRERVKVKKKELRKKKN